MTLYLTALGFGLLIGAQHAFEPDHLAAIGTMLPDELSPKRAAARGAWWGLGHGLAIASIGLALILLGLRVPETLETIAETIVAAMLIGLGSHALWRALRRVKTTGDDVRSAARSTLPVGLIHGLAGSGAAVVLATTQSASVGAALTFIAVFVVGSTLSMTAAAGVLSMTMRKVAGRPSQAPWLLGVSGGLSIAVGLVWGGPNLVTLFH